MVTNIIRDTEIQIQHLLKLNVYYRIAFCVLIYIQIQHLLKLNITPYTRQFNANNSNTTFVKVKFMYLWCNKNQRHIQIQHLLKLNIKEKRT